MEQEKSERNPQRESQELAIRAGSIERFESAIGIREDKNIMV